MDLSVEDIDRARRWLTRFVKKQDVELINAICDKAMIGAILEAPSAKVMPQALLEDIHKFVRNFASDGNLQAQRIKEQLELLR